MQKIKCEYGANLILSGCFFWNLLGILCYQTANLTNIYVADQLTCRRRKKKKRVCLQMCPLGFLYISLGVYLECYVTWKFDILSKYVVHIDRWAT